MDALSEILKVVKLDSAFFFNGEFSAPWRFRSPDSCKLAGFVHKAEAHIIVYHLLLNGRAYAEARDLRLLLHPGDIVIFPHGDAHILESGPSAYTVDGEAELPHIFANGLKIARMGGGGEVARFVCGYMACEPRLSRMFLAGLPPVFKVNIRDDKQGEWLEHSIQHAIDQAGDYQAGGEAVLAKLCEMLFVETLRRYISQMPARETGWLAAARDQDIGKAIALLHSRPAHPWTLEDLARAVSMSRSALAQRFHELLGEPPIAYLTHWRLQLGAQLLASTSYSVAQIAAEVGYESEPAFNRAFKRAFDLPPARYRAKTKAALRQGQPKDAVVRIQTGG
jgi:AraC-like DNA-binding protein